MGPVLARSARTVEGVDVGDDPDAFFDQAVDLVIEAAGPDAVRTHGVAALRRADVWSVSGTALADPTLFADLEENGAESGHRLRLVPGAIAGLDGVAALSVADDAVVETVIDLDSVIPDFEVHEILALNAAPDTTVEEIRANLGELQPGR